MTDNVESRSGIRPDRLRTIRESRGMSQRELGRLCLLSSSMIRKYELGDADPTTAVLKAIAENLETTADYLLGLSDDPTLTIREPGMNDDERSMLDAYRREGWPGVFRLGAEKISK